MRARTKRLVAGLCTIVIFMVVTVFTGWGFDPASWGEWPRATWAATLVFSLVAATTFPFMDGRP